MKPNGGRRAYTTIKNKLIDFTLLPPGKHIDIQKLADALDLSSIPVREALIRLAEQRFVDCVPQKGFFSRELKEVDLLEDYELIAIVLYNSSKKAISEVNDDKLDSIYTKYTDKFLKQNNSNEFRSDEFAFAAESFCADTFSLCKNNAIIRPAKYALERTHYIRLVEIQRGIHNDRYINIIADFIQAIKSRRLDDSHKIIDYFFETKQETISETMKDALVQVNRKFS